MRKGNFFFFSKKKYQIEKYTRVLRKKVLRICDLIFLMVVHTVKAYQLAS